MTMIKLGNLWYHLGESGLIVPNLYTRATDDEIAAICNGCGPAGGWKAKLVPDTNYGRVITAACDPHDAGYFYGISPVDKEWADLIFHLNLEKICNRPDDRGNMPERMLTRARLARCLTYYIAVSFHGMSAFKAGKEGVNRIKVEDSDPFAKIAHDHAEQEKEYSQIYEAS